MVYTLRILGGFSLDGPLDAAPVSRLPQRRAEAVLALLAVAGDRGATRDRITGLLWPEHDDAHARHCLRNQLVLIRHALGGSVVVEADGAMRLDPAQCTADVQRFDAALTAGASAEAVSWYRGPLLDGFHMDGAAEFDRWMERERARLALAYVSQLEQLAVAAEVVGHWRDAIHWWWSATQQDPYDTRLALGLVRALATSGDRARGLREAEAHTRRLRQELEVEPDAALLDEIARIRSGR